MKRKIINIILLVLWMAFIFIMSSYPANESSSQSGIFVNTICKVININNVNIVSFIVRKSAHIFEYLILTILMFNVIKDYKAKYKYIISISLCFIYSISDEIHQLFISGRAGQIRDVFIDAIGIIFGIIICKVIMYYKKNKK